MKNKFSVLLLACCLLAACNKVRIEAPDDFSIALADTVYHAGDSVAFKITGNPDNIIFYSGEIGRQYDKRSLDTSSGGTSQMSFSIEMRNASSINSLFVLASNNFNGHYDSTGVMGATWTDITSRVKIPTVSGKVDSSGYVQVTDLLSEDEGHPIYIAFRYLSDKPETVKQKYWAISGFRFETFLPDSTKYVHANSNNNDVGFGVVDLAGDSAKWVSASVMFHDGKNPGFPADDDWAISKAFDTRKRMPDKKNAVTIKALANTTPSIYKWRFNKAGIYKAVFIAQNADDTHYKEVVRDISFTIQP